MGHAMPELVVRKHTRFTRLIPVKYVYDGQTGAGIMTDLSMNGTRITGGTVVTVGMVLALQMFIPGQGTYWIEEVKVRWVKGSEFGVTFEMHHAGGLEQLALSRAITGFSTAHSCHAR
jgi:hypothetical protein